MWFRKTLFFKIIAAYLSICMLTEGLLVSAAYALTGGPSQPEFSSFEPVATTGMVNEFTGDFTYNIPLLEIPGPHGSGYPLSLSYHSGESQEGISSWVGYGWTLNAGAINRMKRGFADDRSGQEIVNYNHVKPNRTSEVSFGVTGEVYSLDVNNDSDSTVASLGLDVGLNASLRYNNYRGYSYTVGVSGSFAGASLGYGLSDGVGTFSVRFNPSAILTAKQAKEEDKNTDVEINEETEDEVTKKMVIREYIKNNITPGLRSYALGKATFSSDYFGIKHASTSVSEYFGEEFDVKIGLMITPSGLQTGPSTNLRGSSSEQINRGKISRPAYGYMYSNTGVIEPTSLMDYYKEKDTPWDSRDVFLGIPFSNADEFVMVGEGVSGGFRLHNSKVGHFFPPEIESYQKLTQVGVEGGVGQNLDFSPVFGVGRHEVRQERVWGGNGESLDYNFSEPTANEGVFFRFHNDLGGTVEYGTTDLERSRFLARSVKMPDGVEKYMNQGKRSGRNVPIDYHTNEEIIDGNYDGTHGESYLAYTHRDDVNTLANRYDTYARKQIGEFAMYNNTGVRYVYGLPVYSKNEHSLTYDVKGGTIYHNHLVEKEVPLPKFYHHTESFIGSVDSSKYATTYLVTEIHSPEYIDIGMDGPTVDDIGGWTRFSYKRLAGNSSSDWYKWRIPYKGLLYDKGSLSSAEDDKASATWGEKEIYYLDTVETKTHYAVFHTSDRNDALPAITDDAIASGSLVASPPAGMRLQKLDSIVLFSKADPTHPIQTVNLAYEYSLVPGCPDIVGNSVSTSGNVQFNGSQGKLTLKRVWFEFGGIKEARITPYDFEYEYAHLNPNGITYPTPYSHFNSHAVGVNENPRYNMFNLDVWGNYQEDGEGLHSDMRVGIAQQPSPTFDPAAWQLKRIILPSGGEIHVHYEQDDYTFVQDQLAMKLVKLDSVVDDRSLNNNRFYLDLDQSLGINDPIELQEYAALIEDYFQNKDNQKIFFKFLYELKEGGGSIPDINCYNTEFITGYVHFEKAEYDPALNKIFIQLGKDGPKYLPHQICKDFYRTQRVGLLSDDCSEPTDPITFVPSDPQGNVYNVLNQVGNIEIGSTCKRMNPEYSYLRIPMTPNIAKKGGGVRVKRLLMYDKGLEAGAEVVYGTEYVYKQWDTKYGLISSGVASNEPNEMREENPLVDYIPRKRQGLLSRIISGRDREQGEGPIGESILPSASVGYSTVYMKNIHSGKTNTGFTESTFFTTRDYPYNKYYEALEGRGAEMTKLKKKSGWRPELSIGVFGYTNRATRLSQGFRFVKYGISGRPKRIATYGGDYDEPWNDSKRKLATSQEYTYFEPGEKIPVVRQLGQISYENPGMEVEVVCEQRQIANVRTNMDVEQDVSIGFLGILLLPQASTLPVVSRSEDRTRMHTITKVVSFPVIQKSVKTYQDGATLVADNVGFSPTTGEVVLSRTYDPYHGMKLGNSTTAHNGTRMSYNFLGADKYPELGQKSQNLRKHIDGNDVSIVMSFNSDGYFLELSSTSGDICDAVSSLQAGDLVRIKWGNSSIFGHIGEKQGGLIEFFPSVYTDASILPSTSPLTGLDEIEVVRSGYKNYLSLAIGAISTYGVDESNPAVYHPVEQTKLNLEESFAADLSAAVPDGTATSAGFVEVPDGLITGNQCTDTIVINRINNVYLDVQYRTSNGLRCREQLFDAPGGTGGQKGYFAVDTTDGISQLVFYTSDNPCSFQKVGCVEFCNTGNGGWTLSNVTQASAVVLSDEWSYDSTIYREIGYSNNPYEIGEKGKWRVLSAYAYKEDLVNGTAPGARIYKNAGVFSEDLQLFNWDHEGRNDEEKWIRTSVVTQYSPHGEPIEEQNALGIYGCSKFGYHQNVPYIIAQNAEYNSVQFESFENEYTIGGTTYLEENLELPNPAQRVQGVGNSHSGMYAYRLGNNTNENTFSMKPFTLSLQHMNEGMRLKFWLKDVECRSTAPVEVVLESGSQSETIPSTDLRKIAKVEGWSLYETQISEWGSLVLDNEVTPKLMYSASGNNSPIYIDDVRLQPFASVASCYVYDVKTLRLIATFDDQHFGTFNQYNREGRLIRKVIETERGRKTVQETQYNTPGRPR